MVLQIGKAAFEQHGGGRIGNRHEYAAEQIAVDDVEREAADGDEPDAPRRRATARTASRHAMPSQNARPSSATSIARPSIHTYARIRRRTASRTLRTAGVSGVGRSTLDMLCGCRSELGSLAASRLNFLCESVQSPHDPFQKQRAGDEAEQPLHLGFGELFVGSAFHELHFGAAFDGLAERRCRAVAVDRGVELFVVNAAGVFGDRSQQRVVPLGVRAFQDRGRELAGSG